ncbi:hypothetical protein KQH40_00695 [bacterium]|nr:hypothetical protein [bacterium]
MLKPFDISILEILEFVFGLTTFVICTSVIGLQFLPSKFPISKVQRLKRSLLISLLMLFGVFGILMMVDVFYQEQLMSTNVLIPLICFAAIPISFSIGLITYFQLENIGKLYGKLDNNQKENK